MAYHKVEVEFNGQTLTIETGKMARQADGATIVTYGETKVLCTVVSARKLRRGSWPAFFPFSASIAA
jgi:polyribonucleotide nucleotidyltransferase